MTIAQKKRVRVTHIINPNRFFLLDVERSEEIKVLQKVENELQKYCSYEEKQNHHPKKNDIVGYFSASLKWIRCQVDSIDITSNFATLWALDYGVPLTTLKANKLIILPNEYTIYKSPIISSGLTVLPAKNFINNKTKQLEQVIEDFWSDDSLKFFKKLIDSAEQIFFRPSQSIKDEFIVFGELIVEQGGEFNEVDEELLRMHMATLVQDDKFLSYFDRSFSAIIERWNDNNQSGEILNQPDSALFACIVMNTPYDKAQRWLQKRKLEDQLRKEADDYVKESINKVMEWQKKNEEIQPGDFQDKNDTTLDEAFVELESLPVSKVSLESPETPQSSVPSALAIKTRKDFQDFIARKRATLALAERTSSPDTIFSASETKCSTQSSESKRPSKKIIFVPACVEMNTILINPQYVNENFQEMSKFETGSENSQTLENSVLTLSNENFNQNTKMQEVKVNDQLKEDWELSDETLKNPTPTHVVDAYVENWMELEVGADYKIIISDFGSCSSFYIQIVDDSDGWEELLDMLKNVKELKPLKGKVVGKMCLVETSHGELCRAKIIRQSNFSLMCFCVDTAELVYFHNESARIYEIKKEILDFMPFQAMNCRLSGIKAQSGLTWTYLIYSKIIKRMIQQRVRVVRKLNWNPELIPAGLEKINSYEVIVFAKGLKDEAINLGDQLVKYQLADYDR